MGLLGSGRKDCARLNTAQRGCCKGSGALWGHRPVQTGRGGAGCSAVPSPCREPGREQRPATAGSKSPQHRPGVGRGGTQGRGEGPASPELSGSHSTSSSRRQVRPQGLEGPTPWPHREAAMRLSTPQRVTASPAPRLLSTPGARRTPAPLDAHLTHAGPAPAHRLRPRVHPALVPQGLWLPGSAVAPKATGHVKAPQGAPVCEVTPEPG